jgi:hypothetical protein
MTFIPGVSCLAKWIRDRKTTNSLTLQMLVKRLNIFLTGFRLYTYFKVWFNFWVISY